MSEQQKKNEAGVVSNDLRGFQQLVYGTKYVDERDGKVHTIFGDTFVPDTPTGIEEARILLQPTESLVSSHVSDDGKVKVEKYATNVEGVFLFRNFYRETGTATWAQLAEGYTRLGEE
ncbi:hypothetical protein A2714_02215 [Candidatus Woesebacteria bacterium RIFCSPHIGHO2_01_FULL_38_9]|uniref:Uncharacterized protein n=2 Tax=Candidatus Woeseibacteriota TaxID=1752722 RepID=A0A1F7Y4U0_9BACT|nr:MAG: hypothetical protein A2714_02215 [Candidatus Woesebacteria bacterium RIFCSPHIGHO2_01_FULL_38_9]OGM60376.1 MAG: hypothetical protein A3A75_03975 [Candidatus Woesebacteria bacterium RIFCSPLOWO2_01_FULL_39_10]